MSDKREIVGIPCVGGKTRLADKLCSAIEDYCEKSGIRKVYDVCGGGGKLSCSLDQSKFSFIGYNEWEYGLASLMRALQDKGNVVRISNRVKYIIDKVINSDIDADEETKCRVLFDVARKYVSCGPDDHPDLDIVVAATLATIIIWGSVQNNRTTIHYLAKNNAGDIENSFNKILVKNMSYLDNFINVNMSVRGMECTNMDCFDLIKKYHDDADMLLVIDPPYFDCTNGYKNDWPYSMHKELIRLCKDAKCSVMICMHRKGLIPYLSLFDEPDWNCYMSDRIMHVSAKSDFDLIKHAKPEDRKIDIEKDKNKELYYNLIKVMAFQNQEKNNEGVEFTQLEKVVSEYIWCNFESGISDKIASYSDATDAISSYAEDIVYDFTDYTPAEYDKHYLDLEQAEQASAEGKKNKPKKYKNQEVFDQIVELLELPHIEN